MKSTIHVSCAVICNNSNEVLVVQRSEIMTMPLKWEFPGGKIEKGESPEAALIREISEELTINIDVGKQLTIESHSYDTFDIMLYPYFARIQSGTVTLNEHKTMCWMKPSELPTLNWAEADIPIVREVVKKL